MDVPVLSNVLMRKFTSANDMEEIFACNWTMSNVLVRKFTSANDMEEIFACNWTMSNVLSNYIITYNIIILSARAQSPSKRGCYL